MQKICKVKTNKQKPCRSIRRQAPKEMLASLFRVCHPLCARDLPLRVVGVAPHWTPLEKINFSFQNGYQLYIASRSVVRASVHFYSQCWDPIWLRSLLVLYAIRQALLSPCVLVLLRLQSLVSSVSSISSHSFPTGFPESWGKGFDGDNPFRLECSMVSSYCLVVGLWICSNLLQEKVERRSWAKRNHDQNIL